MLRDIRETIYLDLQQPESQRESILAYAEKEGADGVLKALQWISEANRYASVTPSPQAQTPRPRKHRVTNSRPTFGTIRRRLNAIGLDLSVTVKA